MSSAEAQTLLIRRLGGLREVITGPLAEMAVRFSSFLLATYPHQALVIFTRECTGRPRKVSGDPAVIDRVMITELEMLKARTAAANNFFAGTTALGGASWWVLSMLDPSSEILLVMVIEPPSERLSTAPADLAATFGIVATSIQQQVTHASPAYLAESRAASSERARTIAEMTDMQANTLGLILSTLRSHDLDDHRARATATDTASRALVALRTAEDADRDLAEEAVGTAFARLQGELAPLLRSQPIQVEYVAPPTDGRPLPGDVARAARAVVRGVVLAYSSQPDVRRVRIAWGCDGTNLLLELRDDGEGALDTESLSRQLTGRVNAVRGKSAFESIPGWGSRISVSIPLDPSAPPPDQGLLATLNTRELEVLGFLAIGKRNKAIADELLISESTIKFHVASVLRKLGVSTRGEAGAIGRDAGVSAVRSR